MQDKPPIELATERCELKIVPTPEDTRGYDDLRRGAHREPLDRGVRVTIDCRAARTPGSGRPRSLGQPSLRGGRSERFRPGRPGPAG